MCSENANKPLALYGNKILPIAQCQSALGKVLDDNFFCIQGTQQDSKVGMCTVSNFMRLLLWIMRYLISHIYSFTKHIHDKL